MCSASTFGYRTHSHAEYISNVEVLAHKPGFLRGHCDDVGRDVNEIEVSVGAPRDKTQEAGRKLVGPAPRCSIQRLASVRS